MTNILTYFVFNKTEDRSLKTEVFILLTFNILKVKFKFEKLITKENLMPILFRALPHFVPTWRSGFPLYSSASFHYACGVPLLSLTQKKAEYTSIFFTQ